ncbi:MAG: carboxynorspermidine decarboxylase [Kiritimatiellia bacterium]
MKPQTPYYLIDEAALERNLKLLHRVKTRAGVKILLAQKAFSAWKTYPLVAKYLDGTTASGLFEARLAAEEMPHRENHVFNPAFTEGDFREILKLCDHVVFNSPRQVARYARRAKRAGVSPGLRVNHRYSEVACALYDPSSPSSRLGTPQQFVDEQTIGLLDGLHFHSLCEQDADALARTLPRFEAQFGAFLPRLKWVNFGGGHHITRPGYDVELLVKTLKDFRKRWPRLDVYLEPGEAVALNAGVLVASVLETNDWGEPFAILDASAECHMPDVLEMPYRPRVTGAGEKGEKPFAYRLGGPTCLAGDVIGEYSFDRPLKAGDRIVFEDMAIYSMVKNNTFNGMKLPAIALKTKRGGIRMLRRFGYSDFKGRLS